MTELVPKILIPCWLHKLRIPEMSLQEGKEGEEEEKDIFFLWRSYKVQEIASLKVGRRETPQEIWQRGVALLTPSIGVLRGLSC